MKCLLAVSAIALLALTANALLPIGRGPVVPPNVPPVKKWTVNLEPSSAIGYGVVYEGDYFVQAQALGTKGAVTLYSFDADTGAPKWNVSMPVSTGLYVAAGSGLIFAGDTSSLSAFNPSNGNLVWKYLTTPTMHNANLTSGWPAKPTYWNGTVYVTWYNTPMVALAAKYGDVIYTTPYYVGGRIWIADYHRGTRDALFFMKQDPVTTAYASASAVATTGALLWSTTWQATGPAGDHFDTAVVNEYGMASRVFPVPNSQWQKSIVGLDKSTGMIQWSVNGTDISEGGGFDYNIMDDRVCLSYQNTLSTYILACYNIENGALAWAVNLPTQDNSINVAGGGNFIMVYGFNSGAMWAFDYNGNTIFTQTQTKPWYGTKVDGRGYYYGHFDAVTGAAQLTLVQATLQ